MTSFIEKLEAALFKDRMIRPGERLLVACSGGPDSIALFHALKELAPRLKIRLALLHFDHALRRGSRRDLEFVQKLARRSGVPFYGGKGKRASPPPNLSPEESARKRRYEFFKQVAHRTRIRKIALGHHQEDQAETVLMRVLQGTGLRGLQGIRPLMKMEGITFIRPQLGASRAEIQKFLKERSLDFRKDPTNRSLRFLRNRIRHLLLPLLQKEFNPQVKESLCRLAETAFAESAGLDEWAQENWRHYLLSKTNGTLRLDREAFLSLPGALQFRILDALLHRLDSSSGLDFKSWKRIQAGMAKGRWRMHLPRAFEFHLTRRALFVKRMRK